MLTLPSDATHIHISQLTKFFKIQVVNDTESYWMVYSQTLGKWIKMYSTVPSRHAQHEEIPHPNFRENQLFLPIKHPQAQGLLIKAGLIKPTVTKTNTIMISEENLRRIIRRSFEVGYVEGLPPASSKEHLELQFMESSSKLTDSFEQSMVDWFDDRPKTTLAEEIENTMLKVQTHLQS